MKRTVGFCVVLVTFWSAAEPDSAWRTETKSQNERLWRKACEVPDAKGVLRAKTNTIYEIGTGLAYWNGAEYRPSREVLEVIGNCANDQIMRPA
jgi:hypothetical protein